MSESAEIKQQKSERPQAATDSAVTSKILFDDSQSGKSVARFNKNDATACKNEGADGTVLTLMPGQNSRGCDFKGMKDLKEMKDLPSGLTHLDFPSIYSSVAPSTIRFDARMSSPADPNPKRAKDGPMGSGVMIGKDVQNGECLVATANHVVSSDKEVKITGIRGITSDGKTYPADVRLRDPKRDTAVVALQTGADTERICKPLAAVQDVAKDGGQGARVVSLGFPQGSRALYASPGTSDGIRKLREDMSPANIRDLGLDVNGSQLRLRNHVKGGQSGGPVVNQDGKLIGLNQSGPDTNRHSSAVPIDQNKVEELVRRSRRN